MTGENTQCESDWQACVDCFVEAETALNHAISCLRRALHAIPELNPNTVEGVQRTMPNLSDPDHVVIERLERGVRRGPTWVSIPYAHRLTQSDRFAIVINEPEHYVVIRKGKQAASKRILSIPRKQRGMFYLALTKAGATVSHDDIGQLFNVVVAEDTLYHYPLALKKLLGSTLKDAVLLRAKEKHHEVPLDGWSFLWIRRTIPWEESDLLSGIGNSLARRSVR